MAKKRKPPGYWTLNRIKEEARKYDSLIDFQNGSKGAYLAAYRGKFLEEACGHYEKRRTIWNLELVKKEAKKYKTRTEFQNDSPGAYQAACSRKILKSICSHMPEPSNTPYTKAELKKIMREYNTRGELAKGNPSVYVIACKRDDYEELCHGMEPAKGPSIAEKELFFAIKSIHFDAKKLFDRKVKIKNRPHIHGFEIDILVGNLGIEFDGECYHSYKGLRRGRKHWPKKDVENYHKIKDKYFLSKGIIILHIKEQDWKKDKQACIDRCLKFLSGELCQ